MRGRNEAEAWIFALLPPFTQGFVGGHGNLGKDFG